MPTDQPTKPFKPSLAFLRKVEAEQVFKAVGYTRKRGGYNILRGGEAAIEAHATAGLIHPPYIADVGRPSYATLTDAGRALLQASDNG